MIYGGNMPRKLLTTYSHDIDFSIPLRYRRTEDNGLEFLTHKEEKNTKTATKRCSIEIAVWQKSFSET